MLRLDPNRTAILVVDMQNDFCHPDGYYAGTGRDIAPLAAAVAPVADLVAQARASGACIAYTRLVHDSAMGPMESRHEIVPERWTASGDRLIPGTWGAEVVDGLAPRDGDIVIDKAGYSAFESTDLADRLRERGVRTLVLCGVVTYACVLASGFSAFDRGFDVVLVTDAAGSWNAGLGTASGEIVAYLLGRTVTLAELDFAQPATAVTS